MLRSVRELAKLTGLTVRQVYPRLSLLSERFPDHVHTGRNGARLLDDEGFAYLQRLIELEADGYQMEAAVEQIGDEAPEPHENGNHAGWNPDVREMETGRTDEFVDFLREEIQRRDEEIAWLRGLVEDQREEIKALAPGRPEVSDTSTTPRDGFSRWQHLRKALTGK